MFFVNWMPPPDGEEPPPITTADRIFLIVIGIALGCILGRVIHRLLS